MFGQTTNCTRGTSRPYGARSVCRGAESINISSLRDWLKGCATTQIPVLWTCSLTILIVLCLVSLPAQAQSGTANPEPSPTPNQSSRKEDRDPIEKADEY